MYRAMKAVRRSLGCTGRTPAPTLLAQRLLLVLSLLVTTFGATLGAPSSAHAELLPIDRYQLVIKEILVHDDREGSLSGKGEMELRVSIITCPEFIPAPCFHEGRQVGASVTAIQKFQASTGETITLNRIVPAAGDDGAHGKNAPDVGFAALDGYYHMLRFDMAEIDSVSNNEPMGWVSHAVESSKGTAGIGTFTIRSLTHQGARQGDYTVTFEIRPMQLPDVRPVRLDVSDLPNSPRKRVCTTVQNIGRADAGPFMAHFLINGGDSEGGRPVIAALAAGTATSTCVDTALPTAGAYDIRVMLDFPRRLDELNETNNDFSQTYTATPKQAATETPAAPSSAQTDLAVSAVKVNGQAPDGKDDCTDGKNTVTVVVKNSGAANASAFTVRLQVAGASGDGATVKVAGLDAGKDREVTFSNVTLFRGEQTLAVTTDADDAVAESNEQNNERAVTARCKAVS